MLSYYLFKHTKQNNISVNTYPMQIPILCHVLQDTHLMQRMYQHTYKHAILPALYHSSSFPPQRYLLQSMNLVFSA